MSVPVPGATVATETSKSDTNSSTTLLAATANRVGAALENNSPERLYIRLSASAASIAAGGYTTSLDPNGGYYETPYGYSGAITGIWSADSTGYVNVTEFTPVGGS